MKPNFLCAILLIAAIPFSVNAQTGSGHVGIGTLTPTARLQVNHKSSADVPSILILDSAGGNGATIALRRSGSTNNFNINLDDDGLRFMPNNLGIFDKASPILAMSGSSRRLGIGTASPTSRFQINHKSTVVVPTLRLVDSSGGLGSTIEFSGLSEVDFLPFVRLGFLAPNGNSDGKFSISSGLRPADIQQSNYTLKDVLVSSFNSGNVGIGASDFLPARLNVEHRSTIQSPVIQLVDSADGIGNMLQFRKQGSATGLSFTTNLSGPDPNWSVRRIDQTTPLLYQALTSNRTGIGTSNPQATLDVNGSLRIIGVLIALNSAGQPGQVLTSSGPNDPPSWKDAGNNNGPIVDSLPFHAYNNIAEIVTPGGNGKIIGTGGAERFDLGNNYNPQTATYTCHEGIFNFNARISSVVGPIDSEPHNLNLIIEVVGADNTTIMGSYESVLIVPAFVKNNTKFTTDVNTIIHVQENEKVRVRVKHDRLVNMNIKLEEFSGSGQ